MNNDPADPPKVDSLLLSGPTTDSVTASRTRSWRRLYGKPSPMRLKGSRRRLNIRQRWRSAHSTLNQDAVLREGLLALITVGVAFTLAWWWDGQLAKRQEIQENLRFVRQVDIDNAVEKPFQGLRLDGATLSGIDLACGLEERRGCANFTAASLEDANLSGADLTGASLYRARLNGANLWEVTLTGAYLYGADLENAQMIRADMAAANLSYADLSDGDLRGANLDQANLSYATLDDVWAGGSWLGANLAYASLVDANLHGTDLRRTDLTGADLSNADLTMAGLEAAKLTDADLTGADLSSTNLSQTDLTGVDLDGVKCDGFTQWPESLPDEAHPECPFD